LRASPPPPPPHGGPPHSVSGPVLLSSSPPPPDSRQGLHSLWKRPDSSPCLRRKYRTTTPIAPGAEHPKFLLQNLFPPKARSPFSTAFLMTNTDIPLQGPPPPPKPTHASVAVPLCLQRPHPPTRSVCSDLSPPYPANSIVQNSGLFPAELFAQLLSDASIPPAFLDSSVIF